METGDEMKWLRPMIFTTTTDQTDRHTPIPPTAAQTHFHWLTVSLDEKNALELPSLCRR